jgi:hypothetical protein
MRPKDNYNIILPLLEFDSDDDFYLLQIFQRRKDIPELKTNSRCVKSYIVKDLEYLQDRYEEIKTLCDALHARACIYLNRRSLRQTAHRNMVHLANLLESGDFKSASRAYTKAAGHGSGLYPKTWILDVDDPDWGFLIPDLYEALSDSSPSGIKPIARIPSKTGVHIITPPFDPRDLRERFPDIEIKKDNPTNLYIP